MTDAMTHSADDVAEAVNTLTGQLDRVADIVEQGRYDYPFRAEAVSTLLASHEAQAAEIERLKNGWAFWEKVYIDGQAKLLNERAEVDAELAEHKAVLAEVVRSAKTGMKRMEEMQDQFSDAFADGAENISMLGLEALADDINAAECAITRATALMEKADG